MADIGRLPSPSPFERVQPGERIKERDGSGKRRDKNANRSRDKQNRRRDGDDGHRIDEYA
ncbi:hypothetical protein TspCOW1_11340 [Thiohalobacter sp. COW1]|uniref:hypothetical protein n=1 Tax=Thiohalobacter sp. COW1 TaxID=2795687 RepID=UPI0019154F47|nr:hypothetical protein [Thiohalobacter sp. COW1]BCO31031.1 hypothetical protein TspCOW1_11340 [Thiohalobacter sp. COW1]